MPKKTTPLTDIQIRNAKNTGKTEKKMFDGGGLYLAISPSGAKGWRYKFTQEGKERRMSFGPYPATSLALAREMHQQAREQKNLGLDPVLEKQKRNDIEKQERANTFNVIALDWHDKQTHLAPPTRNLHKRRLEKDILPFIGEKPITMITPQIILVQVLRPMEDRGVGEMTARVKSIISQICNYAIACGYLERNPTTDLSGALKRVERGHRAAITEPIPLSKLLHAIDDYDGYKVVKYALQLAPLLFVRPGELRTMKWSEINFESAEWRYSISKTKTDHIVPLCEQALAIIEELKPLSIRSEYVFPSVRTIKRPISSNTLNAALRRMGYPKEEISVHGFRATARTLLDEELHERVDYIEHQLAHNVKDALGRAYNRTKHLKERTRMMQRWADYLDALRQNAFRGNSTIPIIAKNCLEP